MNFAIRDRVEDFSYQLTNALVVIKKAAGALIYKIHEKTDF